jgi:hypothetical protein
VSPNGNAAFATTIATFKAPLNAFLMSGVGAYGGLQGSISNAHDVSDLKGETIDYGYGGGDGWGGGVDFSTDGQTWQLNATLGAGYGEFGHGLTTTMTYIDPICN